MELDPNLYTVAWIAPLEIEARAALYMLDNRHQGQFRWSHGYNYLFHAGDINGHNVIIATLPSGEVYGTSSAAALASQIKILFPNIRFGLLVGVAAGLPNLSRTPPRDIRLGDVLVGLPEGESAGLFAYDLGKVTKDGFQPLHYGHVLTTTEMIVRAAIGNIKIESPNDTAIFLPFYENIKDKEHANGTFLDPGQDQDNLYEANQGGIKHLVKREQRLDSKRVRVWYGPIGSGEKLMKNAEKRNELRDKYNVIGLEMEAAGTMNQIPVGVIRGVCDYGDEYKNKEWQPYAAAMAAAYAKAVLYQILPKNGATQPIPTVSDFGMLFKSEST
jgi:nucleoside phosphorylase